MKQFYSLFLTSMVAISTLAGCSTTDKEVTTTTEASTTAEETTIQETTVETSEETVTDTSVQSSEEQVENSNEASTTANNDNESNVIAEEDLIDGEVVIDDNLQFLAMEPAEKAARYAEYDHINKNTLTEVAALDLSQVKEVASGEEYNELMEKSMDEAVVLYLGFDECPYCRAFIPKLNHLAKELDVTLHYYNTNRRVEDLNFNDVIQFLNIETVPHAFILQQGEIKARINHQNTMQEMEDFLRQVVELNK
ncbi:thioredoxin family protein [Globicatella sanguinis]|uniref:thioredoxin family protein n=1 Tax=Globicatella sanguinis TaxID=13076 RepID=UPI002542A134|nr:thioredoxin family protein [Globicatella sanguinis]MDK7629774.1 thioredoxin family protein [Globicatella sanguinis]WIK67299.1 thioredoxin family protein [Globicatella sanguinis]WKT56704.1 thioredoxin family protein [Globicatella sanguinis]